MQGEDQVPPDLLAKGIWLRKGKNEKIYDSEAGPKQVSWFGGFFKFVSILDYLIFSSSFSISSVFSSKISS